MNDSHPILLVEDDRVDVMTVKRAFKELNLINRLHVVGNGEEALEYLRDSANIRPAFILLDLNMPRMNGIEFLHAVKVDETLRRIPVIMLTTSHEERDKIESFNLSVSGYICKPVGFHEFVEVIKTINLYWTLNEQPA